MEESQVTTVEQNRDDMNHFSPPPQKKPPSRKPRAEQCGKRQRKPDEFELRITEALEEGNTQIDTCQSTGIILSLQNFNEEETHEFQMGVLQLIIEIKHRKLRHFSSQPSPVYNQPLHTSSHVGRNNLLVVYASTMNPHPANITAVQPMAVDTGMMPRTAGQGPSMGNPSVTDNKPIWPVFSTTDKCVFLHGP